MMEPSTSSRRFDPVDLAMLVGIVVILAISGLNVWNLKQLGARVSAIEVALTPKRAGPDPDRIYTIKTAAAQARGPETALVTIVEFSEFQCPFCARVAPTLKRIEETYKSSVRIVWKHLPLQEIHKNAMGASLAAEAAGRQGRFWEFHDRLFADQTKLGPDDLKLHAKELQLDMSRFETDLLNSDHKKKIDADMAEAKALDIRGTPGIFINGRFVAGAQPFDVFAKIIDEELAKKGAPIPSRASSD